MCTHLHLLACLSAHVRACVRACMYSCVRVCVCVCARCICLHVFVLLHVYCTYACMHVAHMHAHSRMGMHACCAHACCTYACMHIHCMHAELHPRSIHAHPPPLAPASQPASHTHTHMPNSPHTPFPPPLPAHMPPPQPARTSLQTAGMPPLQFCSVSRLVGLRVKRLTRWSNPTPRITQLHTAHTQAGRHAGRQAGNITESRITSGHWRLHKRKA